MKTQQASLGRLLEDLPEAVENIRQRLGQPSVQEAVARIRHLYEGRRGLMVVDAVASRQRRYESAVAKRILPEYENSAENLGLAWLAENEPVFLKLRDGETKTMQEVAQFLRNFSTSSSDEVAVEAFVLQSHSIEVRERAIAIKGIGPVIYEYISLLCGADTFKIDLRVREALRAAGIPEHLFTYEGLYSLCCGIAEKLKCPLVHLDQALYRNP